MIKIIEDNYRIYGFIIVKIVNGFSNATFEASNHAFTQAANNARCGLHETTRNIQE
jgi:hypothetical protein